MTSLPVIDGDCGIRFSVEPGDRVVAEVRAPWGNGGVKFCWLLVEMVDDLAPDWLGKLEDPAVQSEIQTVLQARAQRDRDGLSGEEHNITWAWIQEQRRALAAGA